VQKIEFSKYPYVPSILADPIGGLAYEKLDTRSRRGILALFELCWHPRARGFDTSLDIVSSVPAHVPFLLDIDKRLAPEPYKSSNPRDQLADQLRYNMDVAAKKEFDAELNRLYQPSSGFFNWRELVNRFPNAVPVIQVTNVLEQRDSVLRQAELLCVGGASAAYRVTPTHVDATCSLAADILLRLRDPRQLLIIIDCGQGRSRVPKRSAFVAYVIQAIRDRVGATITKGLRAVCMSNSFVVPGGKGLCFRANHDWDVWERVSTEVYLAFGDYAGSQRSAHSPYRPGGWIPTVTHALDRGWLIHRHANKNDPKGWVAGCKIVRGDARFMQTDSWCDKVIRETAASGLAELDKQRAWHAARINGHIERQLGHAKRLVRKTGH
jgi:hypothetical protein